MKTTKRSKMLLSSVAMLLVALVALGSATFAWYTINKQVTATDIQLTASAPGGLQIAQTNSNNDADWLTTVPVYDPATSSDLAAGSNLIPTEVTLSANGATPAALVSAAVGKSIVDSSLVTTTANAASAVLTGQFFVRNTSSTDDMDVKIKVVDAGSTSATNSYFAVAVVDMTNDTILGTTASAGTSTVATTALNSYYQSGTPAADTTVTIPKSATPGTAGTPVQFGVVVYVDGNNTNCVNANYNSATVGKYTIQIDGV